MSFRNNHRGKTKQNKKNQEEAFAGKVQSIGTREMESSVKSKRLASGCLGLMITQ